MSRSEEPVVLVEREGSASVLWFLIGGAVGAGLALLFAPHSGDHTRRVLGRRIKKLRDAADQAVSDLKGAISRETGAADVELEESEEGDDSDRPADETLERKRGVSTARRELEKRLADARARRHRALSAEDEEPVA
jgi:gas vesicle protein